jgi:hypothetical protein
VAVGPCELIIARFPGNQFKGEIAPALARLVDKGTIKIIDVLFAIKDEAGNVSILELKDVDGDGKADLIQISEIDGAIAEDDVDTAAALLEPNSSALLLLFEHAWAAELTPAVVVGGAAHVGAKSAQKGAQAQAQEQAQNQQIAELQAQQSAAAAAAVAPAAAPAAAAAAAGGGIDFEKLKQLGELHTAGVLTDEEFAAAKAKVLAG